MLTKIQAFLLAFRFHNQRLVQNLVLDTCAHLFPILLGNFDVFIFVPFPLIVGSSFKKGLFDHSIVMFLFSAFTSLAKTEPTSFKTRSLLFVEVGRLPFTAIN